MEITLPTKLVNDAIVSDLEISLHPLPILNISDHFTRTRLQSGSDTNPIYGALIGTQIGRKLEIVNTFEILVQDLNVDHGFMSTRQDQFKQVFPTLDLLGFYSVGYQPDLSHLQIQEQLLQFSETTSPLLLLYSSTPVSSSTDTGLAAKELPVGLFEFLSHEHNPTSAPVDSSRPVSYAKCNYAVETSEAERIAVDYVAKPNVGSQESALVANLTTQRNAIKMLHSRLQVILQYLDQLVNSATESQQPIQADHEVLRHISSLIACLPNARDNKNFMNEYLNEHNDALLTSYLAAQTKTLNETNQLVDKYIFLTARDRDGEPKDSHHQGASSSRYATRSALHKPGDPIGATSKRGGGGRVH